jgi:hypothetical protein
MQGTLEGHGGLSPYSACRWEHMSDILPPDSVEVLPKGDIPRRGLYPCGAHSMQIPTILSALRHR